MLSRRVFLSILPIGNNDMPPISLIDTLEIPSSLNASSCQCPNARGLDALGDQTWATPRQTGERNPVQVIPDSEPDGTARSMPLSIHHYSAVTFPQTSPERYGVSGHRFLIYHFRHIPVKSLSFQAFISGECRLVESAPRVYEGDMPNIASCRPKTR